jgi:hypothetical protein
MVDKVSIQYPYRPLDKGHIRLLQLQPGAKTQKIECKLIGDSLESISEYEALSYAWGKHTDPHHMIWIDDVPVLARENLYQALLSLRRQNKPRTLWVDAACINQSDDHEKGSQVHQMGRIYSQAKQVIVWIGAASSSSDVAMKFIQKVYAKFQVKVSKYAMDEFVTDSDYNRQWKALTELCDRRYWKRRWVIQEIALAHKCVIQCGDSILQWDAFESVCLEIAKPNEFHPDRPEPLNFVSLRQSLAVKMGTLRCRHERNAYGLQYLLEVFEESHCKESRDKIYSILSLVEFSFSQKLLADYQKELFEVYVDVMRLMLPSYESKTPDGARKLDSAKSIVRISQAVQRNLGDVSADLYEEMREAISASFSMSKYIPQGIILIQGLKGDTITHLHPYNGNVTAEQVGDEFRRLPSYQNRTHGSLSRTSALENGLAGFDQADKKRVLSFYSRNSYGMMDLSLDSLPTYKPREEEILPFEEMPPNVQGPRPRRRSSLSVMQGNDVHLFRGDSDMMGIVPAAARAGDVICHFLNCDAAAVMRPQGDTLQFVGRTLVFPSEGSKATRLNEYTNKNFKYMVPKEELLARADITIYADIATLQLLTK